MKNLEYYVDISFKNKKMKRIFESNAELKKEFGKVNARFIQRRMAFLNAAPNLSHVPRRPPERCHQLKGRRSEQFAVDVEHPFRLVFIPAHSPIPTTKDGGVELQQVTAIEILVVEGYHK